MSIFIENVLYSLVQFLSLNYHKITQTSLIFECVIEQINCSLHLAHWKTNIQLWMVDKPTRFQESIMFKTWKIVLYKSFHFRRERSYRKFQSYKCIIPISMWDCAYLYSSWHNLDGNWISLTLRLQSKEKILVS